MLNTLYLPEIREMLADADSEGLSGLCRELHPARTAEFMEGLSANEAWQVLEHAEAPLRQELFSYFDEEKQIEVIEQHKRSDIASLISEMPPDDRVDIVTDAIAMLDAFRSLSVAPFKTRVDIQPAVPDQRVTIVDVLYVVSAFSGIPYPFEPVAFPCGP